MATHSSILAWRNSMDRETWWATVHGVAKGWTYHISIASSWPEHILQLGLSLPAWEAPSQGPFLGSRK